MLADATIEIAALGIETTYSAREAAALLKRSYSWLDQRLHRDEFVRPDGSKIQPVTDGCGYRYFSIEMLKDIATCCYRHRWFSFDEVKSVFRELVMAVYGDTGEGEISG